MLAYHTLTEFRILLSGVRRTNRLRVLGQSIYRLLRSKSPYLGFKEGSWASLSRKALKNALVFLCMRASQSKRLMQRCAHLCVRVGAPPSVD